MELLGICQYANVNRALTSSDVLGKKTRGRRGSLSRQDIEDLQDGKELHEAVQNDPAYLEVRISTHLLKPAY